MANHVARAANLGASVLIRESWYNPTRPKTLLTDQLKAILASPNFGNARLLAVVHGLAMLLLHKRIPSIGIRRALCEVAGQCQDKG